MKRVLLSCFCLAACTQKTVLRVGDYEISARMLEQRLQVARVFYPTADAAAAKTQLMNAYTYAQILKNGGRVIDDNVIAGEIERIDKSTRAPDQLRKIKAIFGSDDEGYRKVFILPTYVERVIFYDFFLHDERVQAEAYQKVKEFVVSAQAKPQNFERAAKAAGATLTGFTLNARGLVWDHEKKLEATERPGGSVTLDSPEVAKLKAQMQHDPDEETRVWREHVLKGLKAQQVFAQPIDMNEYWLVVKYLGKVGKEGERVQVASFKRREYQPWLEAEKAKVKVSEL